MQQLILATSNPGKLAEIQPYFAVLNYRVLAQSELNIPEVAENGLTFVENAIIKARHAAKLANSSAIADDSGIVVDALNGAPGIYSARYAGKNATKEQHINKLLTELGNNNNRRAHFYCVMVFMRHWQDAEPIIAEGKWEGEILHQAQGKHGFGYDPIFYVPTHHCAAAELELAEKNRISHRGQALQQLLKKLQPI